MCNDPTDPEGFRTFQTVLLTKPPAVCNEICVQFMQCVVGPTLYATLVWRDRQTDEIRKRSRFAVAYAAVIASSMVVKKRLSLMGQLNFDSRTWKIDLRLGNWFWWLSNFRRCYFASEIQWLSNFGCNTAFQLVVRKCQYFDIFSMKIATSFSETL